MSEISKGVGIVIVVLALYFPVEGVFSAALAAILLAGFQASSSLGPKEKQEPLLPGKLGIFLDQFKHLDRLLFLLKISLNVVLSYLLAAVLFSSLYWQWNRLSS